MTYPRIFTHRGLEPTKTSYYSESTLEAFADQLKRGFNLELDLNFTRDGIVLYHDATLARVTNGADTRALKDLSTKEACHALLPKGRLATFEQLMLAAKPYPDQMLAVHFKGATQTVENTERLFDHLKPYGGQLKQILLFDVTPTTAYSIQKHLPALQMAASVAHPYDIERYQSVAKGTLLCLEELLTHLPLYAWAWLDEWDLAFRNPDGSIAPAGKKLYTRDVFEKVRRHGLKIALVTPELHGTSPGLLGGEAHADAKNRTALFARIAEILQLAPDAVCTDYHEEVRLLCMQMAQATQLAAKNFS